MTGDPTSEQHPIGTLWALDLQEQAPQPVTPGVAATFRRAGPEDARSLGGAMGPGTHGVVLERFGSGRRSYVGIVDGALATYGWVSMGEEWINELGLHVRLADGDAYIWDCATLPTYRGKGLYPALLAFILSELRAEGLRWVWIGADTGSVSSQRGIVRVGFQPVADVSPTPGGSKLYVTGRPGAPEALVQYVRDALGLE